MFSLGFFGCCLEISQTVLKYFKQNSKVSPCNPTPPPPSPLSFPTGLPKWTGWIAQPLPGFKFAMRRSHRIQDGWAGVITEGNQFIWAWMKLSARRNRGSSANWFAMRIVVCERPGPRMWEESIQFSSDLHPDASAISLAIYWKMEQDSWKKTHTADEFLRCRSYLQS